MKRKYLINYFTNHYNPSREFNEVVDSVEDLDKALTNLEGNMYVYNITIKLFYE